MNNFAAGNTLGPVLKEIKSKQNSFWSKVAGKQTLALFHSVALRVPAYKDFLKKQKVHPEKIRTIEDFKFVPPVNKQNYLHLYPYEKLFWDGTIKKPLTIHSTSGSTGEATYFQRQVQFDLRREIILENFFRANEQTLQGPTLFIVTFGMGIWSAGMGIHTAAYLSVNRNNFPISIIAPGVSKIETLKILKNLAPHYKQVIIAGYPPFVKDVIDEALDLGIDTRKINMRFVFTGEAFTEELREYLATKTNIRNIFLDTMNTYGTSEFGATAVETPLSILARRLGYARRPIFKSLFGSITKTPTIAQYIPHFVNFEAENGELFLTGDSPMPLIKYQSGDNGGVMSYEQLEYALRENGIDLETQCRKYGLTSHVSRLPMVYVYERKNLTASLYGVLIYPEFIKVALFDRQLIKFLTGKFTMLTKYDKRHNQYLEINLELRKGVKFKKVFEQKTLKKIVQTLRNRSSEYNELVTNMKIRVHPTVVFWDYEYELFFAAGNKQKWVKQLKPVT
jgi:phenylacetate-CoA ligase